MKKQRKNITTRVAPILILLFLFFSQFTQLSLPDFVFCFDMDGHVAVEPAQMQLHCNVSVYSPVLSDFTRANPILLCPEKGCIDVTLIANEILASINYISKSPGIFLTSVIINPNPGQPALTKATVSIHIQNLKTSYILDSIRTTVLLI